MRGGASGLLGGGRGRSLACVLGFWSFSGPEGASIPPPPQGLNVEEVSSEDEEVKERSEYLMAAPFKGTRRDPLGEGSGGEALWDPPPPV